MKLVVVLFMFFVVLCSFTSDAADSDTKIYVNFAVKLTTASVLPRVSEAMVDVRMTLRANGSVVETYEIAGGAKGGSQGKLGTAREHITYRVVDASTIVRTVDEGNYVHRTTVRVSGKNCTADVVRELKPGNSVYRVWVASLKRRVEYKSVDTVWTTCVIE
ncbi:hypothetical protein [Bradyrhizobium sp.]|uniref:hypothetical protein n=1 Tax=Bradyrhizobium sp. TaxID=376 RepID=UPI001D39C95F|nr:hypothetical protein [Bradyrhizobium sp.]MBI5318541.1 hypothetical protein [Bradyrhizobium sp.]